MSDISNVQQIRQQILARYRSNPKISVNVSLTQPKLHLTNVPAEITGVYAHIFQIEEAASGQKQRHTLQYADVLLHHIEFSDL